jgi:hypothetical protein
VSFLETENGNEQTVPLIDRPETVILLPYSEFLRYPAMWSSELCHLTSCTLVFCPDIGMKPFVRMLKASLTEVQKNVDDNTSHDFRSILLSATRELNRELGFPAVVLSHAWKTALEGDGIHEPVAISRKVESDGFQTVASQHIAQKFPSPVESYTRIGPGSSSAGVGYALEETPELSDDAMISTSSQTPITLPDESSGTESLVSSREKPRALNLSHCDGLVHTPLEIQGEPTRMTFSFQKSQRNRRSAAATVRKGIDTSTDATQGLRPYGRSLTAAQAAEQQEMSRRLYQHALSTGRVKGIRGRVAAEVNAALSLNYESSVAPSSELSDAMTSNNTPDSESSGWLTSAEPTPRSADPPVEAAGFGDIISEEEEEEDWDEDWSGGHAS